MADMDNFSEINENFDTIKTLLNSIRAQGILNTSDVDKLLTGINAKLEKINTEEDIDLIKIFLSELKQNLEERHSMLISKFGAIESLFSNLLKNSTELPKSSEIKELFDIVATNLSVFSREVVSQKDTLTDITLRIDALRSDDSQKKDIIKNIALLRPDLERLNNGFDSIVISLNDNFKTIIKTITTIDKTEYLDKFSDNLNSIEMSSNTILSALQMLDKKTQHVEDSVKQLVTKEDLVSTNQRLFELNAQSQEISATVTDISDRQMRFDSLADKVDAAVNVIASIKSIIVETEDKHASDILEQIQGLELGLKNVSSEEKFEDIKRSLEIVLQNITEGTSFLDKNIQISVQEIKNIVGLIEALEIKVNFANVLAAINKVEDGIKTSINEVSQKLTTLQDANIARVLNDITSEAETLGAKLNSAQSAMAILCEKNFGSIFEHVADLKNLISQVDENSVSANNAIFSSITDRLTVFENSLRTSLDIQEKNVSSSTTQLAEQIEIIKNLSSVLDYKMDSSVIEVGSVKNEFVSLKKSVDEVLALDFVNTVKDLRVDIYASKQELQNSFENTNNTLAENFTNDLYGKYELIISKLDSVEDEFKKTQASTMVELKNSLDNISSSIVDILSYVSETKNANNDQLDLKIAEIANILKENSLDYVETVRDIVDVIKVQVENNLKDIEVLSENNFELVKRNIIENSDDIKKEIKYSYSKLLEIQDSYSEIKEILNVNNIDSQDKIKEILASTEVVKSEFDSKLSLLKASLLDKISEFKQEFTCENADKVSELKFSVENFYNKNSKDLSSLLESLKAQNLEFSRNNSDEQKNSLAKIIEHFESVKKLLEEFKIEQSSTIKNSISELASDIESLEEIVNKSKEEYSTDLSKKVETLTSSFIDVKNLITSIQSDYSADLTDKTNSIIEDFSVLKTILDRVDENIDGDMTRQLSIIESNFEALVSQITILFDKSNKSLTDKINDEFINVSERINEALTSKLEEYKIQIEESFDKLQNNAFEQTKYLQDSISNFDNVIKSNWEEQANQNLEQIENVANNLKIVLDDNLKLTANDYVALKNKINELAKNIESSNQALNSEINFRLDNFNKYFDSTLEIQTQEANIKQENLLTTISDVETNLKSTLDINKELLNDNISMINSIGADVSALSQMNANNNNMLEELTNHSKEHIEEILENQKATIELSKNIEDSIAKNNGLANVLKADITTLNQAVDTNKENLANFEHAMTEKMSTMSFAITEITNLEQQALSSATDRIVDQLNSGKQMIELLKVQLLESFKNEINTISTNVEKETDIVIAEIIEQFDILKKSQADDIVNLTGQIEDIVNAHIYNSIEDLKSYLDIKTDNSVTINKLDNIKTEVSEAISDVIGNLNKLLDANLFVDTIKDFRATSELFITSAIEKLNTEITSCITAEQNSFEEKLCLFDKKFIDTLVDKFEELKLLSNQCNTSFEMVQKSLSDLFEDFDKTKVEIQDKIDFLAASIKESVSSTNKEIATLSESFDNLRSQISNKSFDEAFQASINKQISGLESLVGEQLSYLEDINTLCQTNLPDIVDLNNIVKHSILDSIDNFSDKLDDIDLENQLELIKSDILTQILSVFNQISFVTEQEEILDFVQEKHDELVKILSHMVTTSSEVEAVKNNLSLVDSKISSLKDEIAHINEKISEVISSEGNIDYVYSLQDLESDIANLRLVLNEMKENNHSQELTDLINSTNEIYKLVESMPNKSDIEAMAEDIVSISSRTNKLILASDESYKTLNDNLQDFKLVINDLDERTRNFAQESGMDRIDSKLNAINSMMLSGAKTNQVFNQVFEYLAEWVDNAGVQINAISDKVETLSDIGQIKDMLIDLKAGAADNSESEELVEALGVVFEKQAKRISALETKLDRIIVETTINNQNNKLDTTPLEDTLNRFLSAMDEKILEQQAKINSLESKLENVLQILDEKDTAALTKKVAGMDKQVAKLNKNIEKIASHVVEK